MIEIVEIDYALGLAQSRASSGMLVEARDVLRMLFDEIGAGPGPEAVRALHILDSSGWVAQIDWAAIREECLLALNVGIIAALDRIQKERTGRSKGGRTSKKRQWALALAGRLAGRDKQAALQALKDGVEFAIGGAAFRAYCEGDRIYCDDLDLDRSRGDMSARNFIERYLK